MLTELKQDYSVSNRTCDYSFCEEHAFRRIRPNKLTRPYITKTCYLCKEHFDFVKDCIDRSDIVAYKLMKKEYGKKR